MVSKLKGLMREVLWVKTIPQTKKPHRRNDEALMGDLSTPWIIVWFTRAWRYGAMQGAQPPAPLNDQIIQITQSSIHIRIHATADTPDKVAGRLIAGAHAANDEAHGSRGCKENVQNWPVALVEATEKLREGCNRQFIEPSPDRLREVVEIHGAA